jgi:DNA-binding NtrC family response regulator
MGSGRGALTAGEGKQGIFQPRRIKSAPEKTAYRGDENMPAKVHALLIHREDSLVAKLKPLLKRQGMAVSEAGSLADIKGNVMRLEPPALIFTDIALTDGTWADIKAWADTFDPPVPVIVVSRWADLQLYLDVLEGGAADFIVPPFFEADLAWVVQNALRRPAPHVSSPIAQLPAETNAEVTHHAENHTGSGSRAAHA